MKRDRKLKVEVAGHTDSTGNPAANQAPSEKRAATVKKTLTDKYGVEASRLTAEGCDADQRSQTMAAKKDAPSIVVSNW